MIIAELVSQNENVLMMRFSNPNQNFGNNAFFQVATPEEAKRRMYFKNREYVVETLGAWLRQRRHALNAKSAQPSDQKNITRIDNLISWVYDMEKRGFAHICSTIKNKRQDLESIAPTENSRCHAHYAKTIMPILEFCTNYK